MGKDHANGALGMDPLDSGNKQPGNAQTPNRSGNVKANSWGATTVLLEPRGVFGTCRVKGRRAIGADVVKKVAKLLIVNNDNEHLLMYRSNHPRFGNDPDLPGGTLEEGESTRETMIREVYEEAGIVINAVNVREVYAGSDYSVHGTHYSLFTAKIHEKPEIIMSWEHSSYEWLDRESFLEKAKNANDTYMHMVYDVLK